MQLSEAACWYLDEYWRAPLGPKGKRCRAGTFAPPRPFTIARVTLTALKVQGPYKGISGHDHLTREFVRGLVGLGVDVELLDHPGWGSSPIPPEKRDPLFDALSRPVGARVFLRFGMPHQLLVEPRFVNVNYTMFEASRIHPSWVSQATRYDRVIVPTDWVRDIWIANGAPPDRVCVCPLGIDTELYGRPAEPLPLPRSASVRFLNVSEDNLRKNLRGLAEVWKLATTPDDDALLILKVSADEGAAARYRQLLAGGAPVAVLCGQFSDEEMRSMFAAATHYISLSRGEGWDLPMMEAAAAGLELVAPWHSAYRTYLDDSSAHLIESREVPVDLPPWDDNFVLFEDAAWWDPDQDRAVETVRSIVGGTAQSKPPPRERILSTFSWEAAARRLLELLSEIEPKRRRFFRR